MKPRALLLLLLVAVWCSPGLTQSKGEDEVFPEYRLKAAFLYNFAKFTTWPSNSFATARSPLKIGIIGEDPFGPLLPQTIEGKLVHGRKLEIVRRQISDDLADCHMLFISSSETEHLPKILSLLRGRPVLTISELERFAQTGGMIRIFVKEKNVRFDINVQAVEAAGLQMSSKLGLLGTIVRSEPRRK
jgi:hypothetical protein